MLKKCYAQKKKAFLTVLTVDVFKIKEKKKGRLKCLK